MSSASTDITDLPPAPTASVEPPRPRNALLERARQAELGNWVTVFVLVSCVLFVITHLQPRLILSSSTPAGGDMGAHVWAPAYLRDELLPNLRLSGWTPDWYAGFPALQFYMVVPMLAIVALDLVLPYGTAFKIIAVSGVVTMPLAVWLFGRLADLRRPVPELMAVGSVAFLFDRTYSILGGNILSTLAGEFSFSISLSLSIVYLGLVANGLRTGRYRALATVVVALVALTHVIPLFFAIVGTFVLLALYPSRAGLRWVATSAPVGALLAMWWLLPFWFQRTVMNDMGWEKRFPPPDASLGEQVGFWLTRLFPEDVRLVAFVAIIGVVMALTRRVVPALFLVSMLLIASVGFVVAPQGRLWNERLLPFVHLCTYLLAAFGVAELLRFATERRPRFTAAGPIALSSVLGTIALRLVVGRRIDVGSEAFWPRFASGLLDALTVLLLAAGLAFALRWVLEHVDRHGRRRVRAIGTGVLAAVGLGILAFPLHALPFGSYGNDGAYRWLAWSTHDSSQIPGWARWNFSGYEGKAAWSEYEDVVLTMGNIGERNGCGRAMWEYSADLDRYGTPMALMLLPMWTDGCIGSMEGLYFESSVTTPYHFLNQSALSESPSRAQRDMPYRDFDIDLGVEQLQLMGVRYYMALSELAQRAAHAHPDLVEIARSGPWVIHEVQDSPLVEGLAHEPIVRTDIHDAEHEWTPALAPWFQDPDQWELFWASSGPDGWQRTEDPTAAERRELPPVEVSNIETGTDFVRFQVSGVGTPVLVKTSYHPNWEVSGADGPWRVSPNFMVVVPTDTEVELTYGRSVYEFAGWGFTWIGLVLVVLLARAAPLEMPAWPARDESADDDPDDDHDGSPRPRVRSEPTWRPTPPGDVRLSVVVPAYNESAVIGGSVKEILRVLGDVEGGVELVVVDDGSGDDTSALARSAGAHRVVTLPENTGKGAAVRAGALAATGRSVVFTDADLAYAPDQILLLLDHLEQGWDMVVGSRYASGSTAAVSASLLRRVGGRAVNVLVRFVLAGDHADTQCGLKGFRRDVAHVLFSEARVDGFAFDVELYALAERHRLSLLEAPVRVVNSTSSSVRLTRDTAVLVLDLLRISWWLRRGGYPPVDPAALPPPRVVGEEG